MKTNQFFAVLLLFVSLVSFAVLISNNSSTIAQTITNTLNITFSQSVPPTSPTSPTASQGFQVVLVFAVIGTVILYVILREWSSRQQEPAIKKPAEEKGYCKKCGSKLPKGADYCIKCGTKQSWHD